MATSRGDAKRNAVIQAAEQVFLDQGYARSSMDAIALSSNVSKRTVYNHFPSKRHLFQAVVAGLYKDLNTLAPGVGVGITGDDPAQVLDAHVRRLLAHLRRPQIIALLRLIIAELPRFPELGQDLYAAGKGPAVAALTDYLARLHGHDGWTIPNPALAASQFLGSVKELLFWPILLGGQVGDDDPVIAAAIRHFQAGYHTSPHGKNSCG